MAIRRGSLQKRSNKHREQTNNADTAQSDLFAQSARQRKSGKALDQAFGCNTAKAYKCNRNVGNSAATVRKQLATSKLASQSK